VKVLLVDDEKDLVAHLERTLVEDGHDVECAYCGRDAVRLTMQTSPDVLVLDLMMPGMTGTEVCRRVRMFSDVPIVMLSGHRSEQLICESLDAGADDYVIKPFSLPVLKARLIASSRRARIGARENGMVLDDGFLCINLERSTVHRGGELLELRPRELQLLAFLARNAHRVLSQSEILRCVWGAEHSGDSGCVPVYVCYLRRKIERDPSHPEYIVTRHGVGYEFHMS